jgi:acetyltransferase-like isoleucine patch superfamily enzyme
VIRDDVFVGPGVVFTNDLYPRSFNSKWEVLNTLVETGASIGANSTIVCGVTIGEYSIVGAGSVVTKNVEPYTLVVGNPAKVLGKVDKNGLRVK